MKSPDCDGEVAISASLGLPVNCFRLPATGTFSHRERVGVLSRKLPTTCADRSLPSSKPWSSCVEWRTLSCEIEAGESMLGREWRKTRTRLGELWAPVSTILRKHRRHRFVPMRRRTLSGRPRKRRSQIGKEPDALS